VIPSTSPFLIFYLFRKKENFNFYEQYEAGSRGFKKNGKSLTILTQAHLQPIIAYLKGWVRDQWVWIMRHLPALRR
jgi:hypothetical protein